MFVGFLTILLLAGALAWNPDMPGGMKVVIEGNTYSFTTDICSGGVFFKRPVHIQMKCLHGYFLARPNGCSMDGASIIGGQNYVCQRVNKDKSSLTQALIPVTNPEQPLDHTITLFDDLNTLKNLRRFTYVRGLEGNYESTLDSEPAGVIITNTQKTPKMHIGKLCYEGKSQHSAFSHMATLPTIKNAEDGSSNLFLPGCDVSTVEFPWGRENAFNFSQGYSDPGLFESEVVATLPGHQDLHMSLSAKTEIWGGLAYCLQANTKVSDAGRVQMNGLHPSLESLRLFCPSTIFGGKKVNKSLRKRRDVRNKRGLTSSPEFDTLMACVSTCWKDNPDKCHQSVPTAYRLPLCPPYCGGSGPRHRGLTG